MLQMMERAFIENERVIQEEMVRISKTESPEFSAVFNKIEVMNDEISRLIAQLNGSEYRRTIAEVVTRDFDSYVNSLRNMMGTAKESYIQNLGEIVCDRSKVEVVRDNLNKLFYINRKPSKNKNI